MRTQSALQNKGLKFKMPVDSGDVMQTRAVSRNLRRVRPVSFHSLLKPVLVARIKNLIIQFSTVQRSRPGEMEYQKVDLKVKAARHAGVGVGGSKHSQ